MGALEGMVFCITGTLSMLRRDFENLLRAYGGSVRQRVNKEVSHLICADAATNKAQKAKRMGIAILSEEQVMDLLGLAPATTTSNSTTSNSNSGHSTNEKRPFDSGSVDSGSETEDEQQPTTPAKKKTRFLQPTENSLTQNDPKIEIVETPSAVVDLSEEEEAAGCVPEATRPGFGGLADGEEVEVVGRPYKIKNVGGVYSCTCPAWHFQSKKIDVRTCKHIKELRGDAAEEGRIGSVAVTKKKNPHTAAVPEGILFDATKVTLAHPWDNAKHGPNANNYVMSEKLDGMRAIWNGQQLMSRGGNPISAPDFFLAGFPVNIALDGELFLGRGKFQQLVSIARRQNGGDLWKEVKYVVFDSPTARGGFEHRLDEAKRAVASMPFAEVLEHKPCRNLTHMQEELETITSAGGEGLMMRLKGSDYPTGRSTKLLKVKTFKDDEGLVTEHQPGAGRHKGRMGALVCRLRNGKVFKVGTGFSDAQRENPPPVGSVVTVQYFELTNSGVPRFPSFLRVRKDVPITEFD